MRIKIAVFVGFFVAMITSSGCSLFKGNDRNCQETPLGPSCVDGPVDGNNLPPGPCKNASPEVCNASRASVHSYGVYEGDCPNDLTTCGKQLTPTNDPVLMVDGKDETYVLSSYYRKYTVWLCVQHREVLGRILTISVGTRATPSGSFPNFDEGDPARKSPVCISGTPFDMTFPNGGVQSVAGGSMSFSEGSQDLLEPTEWRRDLGFRVVAP